MALARRLLSSSLACSPSNFVAATTRLFASQADALTQAKQSNPPTITAKVGQAFPSDLRSTSGLGLGDGIHNHTDKWLQVRMGGGQRCSRDGGGVLLASKLVQVV